MYHALLPQKTVKALKTEYRVRLLIVCIFFASFGIVVASFFLFPSYIISSFNKKTAAFETSNSTTVANSATIAASLSSTGQLVSAISSSILPPLSPIIARIASIKPSGISITSFNVTSLGVGASSTVTIDGSAATRDDLVAFRKVLEGDAAFSGVQVPISDFAPSADLNFSLQMSANMAAFRQIK